MSSTDAVSNAHDLYTVIIQPKPNRILGTTSHNMKDIVRADSKNEQALSWKEQK